VTDAAQPGREPLDDDAGKSGKNGKGAQPQPVAEALRERGSLARLARESRAPRTGLVSPDRERQLVYGAAGLLIALFGVLFAWVFPAWLTRRPSSGMTAAQHLSAVNDARTALAALLVAVGAIGSLLFTGRSYRLNREGHVTDRYTKAVGQLGDASSPVRIGGVYALERIAKDSVRDRTTIIYVLGAFVKERSRVPREREDDPPGDVIAGIRVTARLLAISSARLNLRDADLRNVDMSNLPMDQLMLEGADLRGAMLPANAPEDQ
jgi:hypothetical protein